MFGTTARQFSGKRFIGVARFGVTIVLVSALTAPAVSAVELVSVAVGSKAGNSASNGPIANTNGNLVAFYSDATDLVRGDINQVRDVFLRNRSAGTTEIISVNSAEEQANRPSHAQGDAPAINGAGTLVGFYSDATNLVDNDNNSRTDVFVRDVGAGTTTIVSVSSNGSQGNGPSLNPSMDDSGNLVAFQSLASNLISGDGNGASDIFVRNRSAATTERICNTTEGNGASFAPAISADGYVVAFTSAATNLVPNDTNNKLDVFVCDRRTNVIEIISVSSADVLGNGDSIVPDISADGRFVAYKSLANNLVPDDHNGTVDVFFRDRTQRLTLRVSVNFFGGDANEGSFPPSISDNGRFVAFGSAANNIVANDVNHVPSVFVRDVTIGITLLVDLNDDGEQADDGTPDVPPAISGDGRQIGFVSFAANLNSNDDNGTADVYIARFVSPNDCCQCGRNACEAPDAGRCPAGCEPVPDAVCLEETNCTAVTPSPTVATPATFTPTPTETGTPTETATITPTPSVTRTETGTITPTGTGTVTPTVTTTPTTPTITHTSTVSPTQTPTTSATVTRTREATITPSSIPTATKELDKDACQCAVSPQAARSWNGGLLWMSGIAALVWRQRKRR